MDKDLIIQRLNKRVTHLEQTISQLYYNQDSLNNILQQHLWNVQNYYTSNSCVNCNNLLHNGVCLNRECEHYTGEYDGN